MKRKILYGLCLIGIFSACKDEREERAVKLPVNVKAYVTTYDQYGMYKSDARGGVSVVIKAGTTSAAETQTDAVGYGSLQATTGTYHFECSKSGYATLVTQPYQLLGGDATYPVNFTLQEVSTTRFEDITLSIDARQMTVGATVYHNFPYGVPGEFFYGVHGIIFMSTSPDVSSTNYLQTATFSVTVSGGKTATQIVNVFANYFPSGTTLYARIYGAAYNEYGTYNAQTGKYTYNTLGPASTTAKLLIP